LVPDSVKQLVDIGFYCSTPSFDGIRLGHNSSHDSQFTSAKAQRFPDMPFDTIAVMRGTDFP